VLERVAWHNDEHYPGHSPGANSIASRWRARWEGSLNSARDEPTGNLDSKNSEAVMELLKELHGGGRDHLHGHARSTLRRNSRSQPSILVDGRIVQKP